MTFPCTSEMPQNRAADESSSFFSAHAQMLQVSARLVFNARNKDIIDP